MLIKSLSRITAIGTYVPDKILTNNDLQKLVDTSDEWILQRTGMRERRIAEPDQFASDLSLKAVEDMVRRYGVTVEDADMILVATSTPEYMFPSTAARLQHKLGIKHTGALDVNAACAGFTYAIQLADGLITSGMYRKILVVGAETLSKITDYTDRTTCVLFGDGAGAILMERNMDQPSFFASITGTFGEGGINLYKTALAGHMDGQELKNGSIVQNGREIYKWAVRNVPEGMKRLMEQAHLTAEEVDWFVPHSANLRMIEAICERGPIPLERTLTSVEYRGNTSAASIPLALQLGIDEGRLQAGQNVLLYGFGGGMTYAGTLLRWTI
ncbi:ketoacyl-ACP synthase III [Paenibacillus lemnae]|uniref:Beta-ketoacyl-[acyl-carrier-protein] synthase III n=1 Tax=Paenibacillus lemnae TaxID=1330551 RepID=A0A848MAV3_PAELE|nr:ketoacyl-ACP synthase III [Paenibacillus lemnae]NMO97389.1 ketoacyl-ACP synthase III [Paenibacillus lemnae]